MKTSNMTDLKHGNANRKCSTGIEFDTVDIIGWRTRVWLLFTQELVLKALFWRRCGDLPWHHTLELKKVLHQLLETYIMGYDYGCKWIG